MPLPWGTHRRELSQDPHPPTERVDSSADVRFLWTFVLLSAVLLAGIGTVNYVVDPTSRFGTGVFQPLVRNVRAMRIDRLKRAADQAEPVKLLVLGSSRVMKLRPETIAAQNPGFEGQGLNVAVNSGGVEDALAYLRLAHKALGLPIEQVVYGLDLETLSPLLKLERFTANDALLEQVPEVERPLSWHLEGLTQLVSWTLTLNTVRALKYTFTSYPNPTSTFDDRGVIRYVDHEAKLADGSFDLDAEIAKTVTTYRGRFEGFEHLDDARLALLEALFIEAARANIRLTVALTPLHPKVAKQLRTIGPYDNLREALARKAKALADKHGARFMDVSAVERFGGDTDDWYDGSHIRERNADRLIRTLFAAGGR